MHVGDPAADAALGRELPAGLRGGGDNRARKIRGVWRAKYTRRIRWAAIVGALLVSLVLIPAMGTQDSTRG